jgi:uncharacterized sulfatase
MKRRQFLKSLSAGSIALTIPAAFAAKKKDDRPNILLIFAEDMCPDMSCYGVPQVKTPILDQMAAEGIRFENAFSAAPVCSASRSGIMCGMYQTSIGGHNHRTRLKKPLPGKVKPYPQLLKDAGYYTVIIGKTDLNYIWDKEATASSTKSWSGRVKDQPFFCQMTIGTTHRAFVRDAKNPIDPKKVELPPYYADTPLIRRDWADYLESIQVMDSQVGDILKRLEDEGIVDNTLVIFTGDHGRCMPRGKQFCYDGGIHVPLIARWPKAMKAGQVRDQLTSSIDIAATIVKCAGLDIPSWMQGRPFFPKDETNRKYIFAARDRCDGTADRIRCVRSKEFKYLKNFYPERPYTQLNSYKIRQYPPVAIMKHLYEQGKLNPVQAHFFAPTRPAEELYDLKADPHETKNLAKDPKYAKVLREYRAQLYKWINTSPDMGETPEDPAEEKRQYDDMVKKHEAFLKESGMKANDWAAMVDYWEEYLKNVKAYSPGKSH